MNWVQSFKLIYLNLKLKFCQGCSKGGPILVLPYMCTLLTIDHHKVINMHNYGNHKLSTWRRAVCQSPLQPGSHIPSLPPPHHHADWLTGQGLIHIHCSCFLIPHQ